MTRRANAATTTRKRQLAILLPLYYECVHYYYHLDIFATFETNIELDKRNEAVLKQLQRFIIIVIIITIIIIIIIIILFVPFVV